MFDDDSVLAQVVRTNEAVSQSVRQSVRQSVSQPASLLVCLSLGFLVSWFFYFVVQVGSWLFCEFLSL